MNKTSIEWVRNPDGTQGYTWNPITGCLGPKGTPEKPERCSYCYAHKLAKGRLKKNYLNNPSYPDDLTPPLCVPHTDKLDPFVPRFWRHHLKEPFWHKKPCTIFVCSMGEIFNDYYPASWFGNILHTFYGCPQHRFLVLTKNPCRDEYIRLPKNVWFGVTVTRMDDWMRLYVGENCGVAKKFISFEPLLDDVMKYERIKLVDFDWIIVGSQTKPYKPPKSEWVWHILNEAELLGIPVFLKNNLKPLLGENLRQEFPK